MSITVVARKDFEDAVRSRWLLGLSALFVLLVSGVAWLSRPASGGTASTSALLNSQLIRTVLVTVLIPLIALVVSYRSIVGERETGSLKLMLSLPHSRLDVVFGKVLGRVGAMAVPIGIGFVLPVVIAAAGPFQLAFAQFVGFVALVIVLAAAFVGIAVGFSAAVGSNRLAIGSAVGVYFVFVPLWRILQLPLQLYLGTNGIPEWLPLTGRELFRLLQVINPTGSFKIVAGEFLQGTLFAAGAEAGVSLSGEISALSMLAVWIIGPPTLGLLRFESEDL
jgi:ABC-2 type transport system permease protein